MTSNAHAVIQWWTEAHYGDCSRAFNFVGGHTSGAIWSSNTIANCCNCNQTPLLAVPIAELAWQPFVIRTSILYMSAPLHVTTQSTRWITRIRVMDANFLMLHFGPVQHTFRTVWTLACVKLNSSFKNKIFEEASPLKSKDRLQL